MKLKVGTQNEIKIQAVREAALLFPKLFLNTEVQGVDVKVDLFGHPKTLKDTISGAIDRAKQAFVDCDFSFGLEGGLMEVPFTKTGYMEVGACAVYDGKNVCLGLSPAFEWPVKATELIVAGQADGSQALKQIGFTAHEKLGAVKGGAIGVLSHGHMIREDFTKYSIIMAVVQLENPEFY